jgi:FkbM family methyltransferase
MINTKEYLRFRWSHDNIVHRRLVRTFNSLMQRVPFRLKYAVGMSLRRGSPPYNLIKPGAVVVQIGAPMDTLSAGRSRAVYFCLLAGEKGKAIIVEPDQESLKMFEAVAQKQGIRNAIFVPYAAWSKKETLRIYINPRHPASNFINGTKELDDGRLAEFHQTSVAANTLDDILAARDIQQLDLVSITTNGSEREIIKGMLETISRGISYICLARTGDYIELMKAIGYELYTYDDRGMTFRQSGKLRLAELRKVL